MIQPPAVTFSNLKSRGTAAVLEFITYSTASAPESKTPNGSLKFTHCLFFISPHHHRYCSCSMYTIYTTYLPHIPNLHQIRRAFSSSGQIIVLHIKNTINPSLAHNSQLASPITQQNPEYSTFTPFTNACFPALLLWDVLCCGCDDTLNLTTRNRILWMTWKKTPNESNKKGIKIWHSALR